jgi:hypothetical protein
VTTISRHTYGVSLDDGTPLSPPTGGNLTLDASASVHVQASIALAVEDAALLAELDPRDSRRVVLSAQRDGAPVRVFDLGIRSTSPNRADGTVSLELASDEAILRDFAQLGDDTAPRALEASVRGVCNYVLGKVGAAVEPGSEDADVTAYWAVTNLLLNPSVEGVLAPWTSAGNCALFHATIGRTGGNSCGVVSSAAGVMAVSPDGYPTGRQSVTPGDAYVFSGYGRLSASTPRSLSAVIRFYDQNGNTLWADYEGASVPMSDANWNARAHVVATAPVGATQAAAFYRVYGSTSSGQIVYIDDGDWHKGAELVPPFTGATPDDAHYEYAWSKDANASHSTRTPFTERSPEALTWRAGVSGMDFLQSLLKTVGLRLVCDEQRRWTLRSEEYRADGAQTWRYGVNITAADESLSRDDETWFDAAVYVYTWTDGDGITQTRTDAYSLTLEPTKVLRHELNTPYPGPGRAQQMVTRAQGKGRTVTVSGIPAWTEHTDQALSILLDGTPIQTGITSRIRFDFDTDTVTISSRTTDTPAGAIDLLPGTINALTGTMANL